MISAEARFSGKTCRTFEEDDLEEGPSKLFVANEPLMLIPTVAVDSLKESTKTLIFLCGRISTPLINSFKRSFTSLAQVATATTSSAKEPSATIYHSSPERTTIVAVGTDAIDPLAINAFLGLLISDQLPPTCIFTFSSMPAASFTGRINGAMGTVRPLMKVANTTMSEQLSTENTSFSAALPLLSNMVTLPVGNVLTGLGAAVVSYSDVRHIPAVAFISITDASISVDSMRAFNAALPTLAMFINDSRTELKTPLLTLVEPNNQDYLESVRHDPFLATTENMYC